MKEEYIQLLSVPLPTMSRWLALWKKQPGGPSSGGPGFSPREGVVCSGADDRGGSLASSPPQSWKLYRPLSY